MAAPILDLLTGTGSAFIVNTAQNQVTLTSSGSLVLVQALTANAYFQDLDNALIQEIGINLPYQYCAGETLFSFQLGWVNEAESLFLPLYSGYLPVVNTPYSLASGNIPGIFLQNPKSAGYVGWDGSQPRLYANFSGPVSMVYNPTANFPDNTSLVGTPWAKVSHLLDLALAP